MNIVLPQFFPFPSKNMIMLSLTKLRERIIYVRQKDQLIYEPQKMLFYLTLLTE